MKKPCEKCFNQRVTLGWFGHWQLTEYGSGKILSSAYLDRLLNADFYPADKRPEDCLDAWPVCPSCGEKILADTPENESGEVFDLPDVNLTSAWVFIGLVFSACLLLLFLL